MTEESENSPHLVRVRAQVMCRDEGTGGWMALGGGGLAEVMVSRRTQGGDKAVDTTPAGANAPKPEYYIHGRRISDNVLVLDCTLKDDFQYHKVMPTFHHWVSDEKRFGLTFQTAADARAFDKGVRKAVNELYRVGGAWPSMYGYKGKKTMKNEDDEENNIFECLNLPSESRSSSEKSTASRVIRDEMTQTPILSAITLPQHAHQTLTVSETLNISYDDRVEDADGERCPYVHLTAVHEYTYTQVGVISAEASPNTRRPPLLRRDSGSLKKLTYPGPPPLPDKRPTETFQARIKCKHCNDWYLESANRAGACEYAPDSFKTCVNCVSCMKCAQCMVYHCMADSEGDFALHPCTCGPPEETCVKRWVGITLLSLLVPCLCCYIPLKCMHRAARSAHVAGGMHAPVQNNAQRNGE